MDTVQPMDILQLLEAYREEHGTLTHLASVGGVPLRYISDVRSGRHRLSPEVARKLAPEFRRVGLIPDSELAELQFRVACQDMPLGQRALAAAS